jgi:sigma-E factor negative regulatory protein RseB
VKARWWLLLSGLLFTSAVLAAPPPANPSEQRQPNAAELLLADMSRSFRELDYRGIFTYEYGPELETMEIFHAVRDGVESERLVYLDGEYREILRAGHELNCIHPGDQILRLGGLISVGPFAHGMLGKTDAVTDHYELALGNTTRVAGREAQVVLVKPLDRYRNGFHLFLDKETDLLLKSMVISPEGKVLERFQFASVQIGVNIADADLKRGDHVEHLPGHWVLAAAGEDEVLARIGAVELEPGWLPPGFVLAAREHQPVGDATDFALYTDGLASLSIYVERLQPGSPASEASLRGGRARKGATVAYTTRLDLGDSVVLVTVVGEVPLYTAQRVARQIALRRPA